MILGMEYGALQGTLERAYRTVVERHDADKKSGLGQKGFDADQATQIHMRKLALVAGQFEEVRRQFRA